MSAASFAAIAPGQQAVVTGAASGIGLAAARALAARGLRVALLDRPDTLFGMSPDWVSLSDADKAKVVAEARWMAGGRPILPIRSTALIAVAER